MHVIEEEVVKPIKQRREQVHVAIGMSLMSLSCPANTVYKGMKPTPCVRIPLITSQVPLVVAVLGLKCGGVARHFQRPKQFAGEHNRAERSSR